jgi:RNA polymerase sigma-70 factor (ECF subfamily)
VPIQRLPKGRNRSDSPTSPRALPGSGRSKRKGSAVSGIEDEDLVLRIAARDEVALELLMESMQIRIFSFIREIVRDDHLAEEVTQDTFLTVWENASRFDGRRQLVPWIFGIARNLARTASRSAARRSRHLAPLDWWDGIEGSTHADVHTKVELLLLIKQVRSAVATLAPYYQEALELRLRWNMTYKEIAKMYDIPLGTVKSRLHKGRSYLRVQLQSLRMMMAEGEEVNQDVVGCLDSKLKNS